MHGSCFVPWFLRTTLAILSVTAWRIPAFLGAGGEGLRNHIGNRIDFCNYFTFIILFAIAGVNEPRVPLSASPRSHLAPVSPTGHVQRYPCPPGRSTHSPRCPHAPTLHKPALHYYERATKENFCTWYLGCSEYASGCAKCKAIQRW